MKKLIFSLILLFSSFNLFAQIPNFVSTCGAGITNGYASLKFRPGINMQEGYSSLVYGLGDYFSVGGDIYTATGGDAFMGAQVRYGNQFSKYFGVGLHAMPSFNVNDEMHFSYFTGGLYLLGAITPDEKLFWCSNTYWVVNDGSDNSLTNCEYLCYNIKLNDRVKLTPMVGAIHDWRFDNDTDVDLAAGCYLGRGKWCFYLWGNDLLKEQPRVVLGIEFLM